jgi:hypothetical protein
MRTVAAFVTALVLAAVLPFSSGCGRKGRPAAEGQRAEIASLEKERDGLQTRLEALSGNDLWAQGMPDASVRIGVPTTLAADLIQRVATGFVDHITIELKNLKVRKSGRIKKVITLGDYDLRVTVNRVTAKLKTGKPDVKFGGNMVAVAMPVGVDTGDWRATINFKWDGKNVSGAVCGDLDITQEMTGGVWPDRYAVAGAITLTASPQQILAEPVFPLIRVKLRVKPSDESWAAAQKILDDKTGACGFVLDRVDVMGTVRRLIDKGFVVRLPTEKIRPLALPVGINPSMTVRGEKVAMGIRVSDLAITPQMIWLGADVAVAIGEEAAAKSAGSSRSSLN